MNKRASLLSSLLIFATSRGPRNGGNSSKLVETCTKLEIRFWGHGRMPRAFGLPCNKVRARALLNLRAIKVTPPSKPGQLAEDSNGSNLSRANTVLTGRNVCLVNLPQGHPRPPRPRPRQSELDEKLAVFVGNLCHGLFVISQSPNELSCGKEILQTSLAISGRSLEYRVQFAGAIIFAWRDVFKYECVQWHLQEICELPLWRIYLLDFPNTIFRFWFFNVTDKFKWNV